jgi:glycosyltransferase involved in cell wall biosynthesis
MWYSAGSEALQRGWVTKGERVAMSKGWLRTLYRSGRKSKLLWPNGASLPRRALLIWQERPDLQTAFDLSVETGRADMFWWYLRHGFRELGLRFDPADDAAVLAANASYPRGRHLGFVPLSWLMRRLADMAPSSLGSKLDNDVGQNRFLAWFFTRGLSENNLEAMLTAEQAEHLLAPMDGLSTTPRLLRLIWDHDPALHTRFASADGDDFHAWCAGDGAKMFPILDHPLIALVKPRPRPSLDSLPFGVNLFGHVRGRSGVAEDARMAIEALEAADIPYSIHNVEPGASMPDEERHLESMQAQRPYAFNLFCMPAPTSAAAMLKIGKVALADHYNIGFWPWELPELPDIWRPAYDLVDEVWASSRYSYAAYCRSAPCVVRHMPMAVSVAASDGCDREDFNLPGDIYLFGFAYDGLSSSARKAPLACVEAFTAAFPAMDEPVGLIIKALRAEDDAQWRLIVQAAERDPRIHLITTSFTRGRLLDLWRCLDCFISLHRAEGFGRNIAEAMLLGKPVIVTAHSGNMDFTLPDIAALVPARLRPVQVGDYPFGAGQYWAEPDIAKAAEHMRRIANDAMECDGKGTAGRIHIARHYGADVVGAAWRAQLTRIYTGTDG